MHRSIPGISERMLIRHLQDLVRDGILIRHQENNRASVRAVFDLEVRMDPGAGAGSDLCVGPYTPSTLESSALSLRAAREEEELVPFCHPSRLLLQQARAACSSLWRMMWAFDQRIVIAVE
jgi:hypothetical protein